MDGIILINKEKDYTSHDVVAIVKKTLGQKVGHTGTLDPNATGILPLLIGKATKISKYLVNHDKIYQAVLRLGVKTDTADMMGKIVEEKNVKMPNKEEIELIFSSMVGKTKQYEYARQDKKVEIPEREIEIYNLKLDYISLNKNEITFTIYCSKGTYIRTICEQIAKKLGTIGCMSELNRIQVGEFHIDNSITIKKLQENKKNVMDYLISIEQFFYKKEKIILNSSKLEQFLNGVKLKCEMKEDIYRIYDENKKFIGLGIIKNELLKRDVV